MSQQEGCLALIPLISVFGQLEKEKAKGNQLTLLNLKTAVNMRDCGYGVQICLVFDFTGDYLSCLQCFDTVGLVAGKAYGLYITEWWCAGIVICL